VIGFEVDQHSVDQTVDYLDSVRLRIFAGVRSGMKEAMEGLAGTAVAEMGAAGIQSRTNQLAENILASPQIAEDKYAIRGRVSAKGKMKLKGRTFLGFLGTALDEGYHVPAVKCPMYQIVAPDGDTFWARGHVAFDVKPHPFFRAASESYAPTLIDIISARVREATEASA
jgi:hypothetical protein